ncbi:hypothetical protein [Pelagicoccus sp. SDUM812003]|uniref:hypothetical protein n=1 Tax=Pelagicoccus sp. SDUM812003 TaxID=3041267 RepID=UPI00280D4263|nr:hypothetical protein [Pelagicoccus sp. SDUM812003]MDQ8205521.1 hypothetical protein [Pelagicoccus sp. SDUM812003]
MIPRFPSSSNEEAPFEYRRFDEVDPAAFIALLNRAKIREHLVQHDPFDATSINIWIQEKLDVDATAGCRVRAITYQDALVGWCGIQANGDDFELAIVIDEQHWGIGKRVFQKLMLWARALGHSEVLIHFLHTRPEYRFLRRVASKVFESEWLGRTFTSYQLRVDAFAAPTARLR